MLNFCSLYSGSSGNCLFVESEKTKILVDVGVTCKKIVTALESININPFSIDGILITHEHTDHIQGLKIFSKKYNTKIYINKDTFNALKPDFKEHISYENVQFIDANSNFEINDLKIKTFSIPHDAANPIRI